MRGSFAAPRLVGRVCSSVRLATGAALTLALVATSGSLRADDAQYFYDPAGRLIAMVDPVNGSAQYSYDSVGNILSVVRRPITAAFVGQVSPSRGPAGTVVTITGTGFGTTSNTTVSFNGRAATPSAVTATRITVAVPAGATTGPVSVTSPAGTAASAAPFTMLATAGPSVSGHTPARIDQAGTITISGSGFDPLLANNKVLINGRYAAPVSATASTITAVVPAVGSGRIAVATQEGVAVGTADLAVPPLPYLASNIGAVVRSTLGSSPSVAVGTAGQFGMLLFDMTAGQRLSMQVTASSYSSGQFILYGPDGAQVGGATDLFSGSFSDSRIMTASGTYTVLVVPANVTGSATIKLNNVPADATATIAANATPVPVTTTAPGQNMKLTFTGTTGQRVNLRGQFDGPLQSSCRPLTMLQPDGTTQLYQNGCFNFADAFTDPVILPVAGTYTILFDPGGGSVGTATFTLYVVPADATVTIAANATPVSLTTTAPGQNMKLTFTGTAGQRVNLRGQFDGPLQSGCRPLTVLQPDGTTQLFQNGCFNFADAFTDPMILPVAGTYTALFDPGGGSVGTATFTLYVVPADATATIAANATPVSLTTTAPGQNMKLTFTGTAGQRVNLRGQFDGPLQSGCRPLTMLQPDGTTQLFQNGCFNFADAFTDMLILPVAGTYTALFDPGGGSVGTATFTLYTVPADATATIAANATPVPVTTTAPGQNMRLTFTGTAGQRVNLRGQFDGPLQSGCRPLTMLQPDGTTQLYQNGCFNYADVYTDTLILPVAGTYTILFDPGGGSAGTATFTLYDNTDRVATITPGGGSVSLSVTQPGQNGELSFSGTQGSRVALLSQFDSSLSTGCSNISIVQPDGATQVYGVNQCGTSVFSDPLPTPAAVSTSVPTLPVSGVYKVRLNPEGQRTGTASFTLYAVPADVTGTRTIGQPASNATTTVPGQAIRATFPGQASQSVTLSAGVVSSTPASPCYRITLLAPDGVTIVRGDQSCVAGYSSGSLSLPQAGTYTIVLDPTDVATGSFSLGVSTP